MHTTGCNEFVMIYNHKKECMNGLENNLEILHARNPSLAQLINKTKDIDHSDLPIEDTENNLKLIYNNQNPQIVLWIGIGNGQSLRAYLAKPHKLNRFVVVIEENPALLRNLLKSSECSKWLSNPSIEFIIGKLTCEIEEAIYKYLLEQKDFPALISFQQVVAISKDEQYVKIARSIWEKATNELALQGQIINIDSYVGFLNFCKNIEITKKTPLVNEFAGLFSGKPGIVVSTGPSLQHSLNGLKEVQDNAVIFCADSALRILLSNGIKPHFTGTIERHRLTEIHYEGVDTKDVVFVTAPIIHPHTYEYFPENKLHILRSADFLPFLFPNHPTPHEPLNCVAHVGLELLHLLGCQPIYLVGQDLAFDPKTKRSHASGYALDTDYESMGTEGKGLVPALSNNGETVHTLIRWYMWGNIISRMIERYNLECYNVIPNSHGISISGANQIEPLECFKSKFSSKINVRADLDLHFHDFALHKSNDQSLNIEHTLNQSVSALRNIIKASHNILDKVYDLIIVQPIEDDSPSAKRLYKHLFQIIESETETIAQMPLYQSLLGSLVQGRHLKLAKESFGLLSTADSLETRSKQLQIPIAWHQEIIIRADMILRKL